MNKKRIVLMLSSAAFFGLMGSLILGALVPGILSMEATAEDSSKSGKSFVDDHLEENGFFVGVVETGKFRLLAPQTGIPLELRLTLIQMQEARPPETGELDLFPYEGQAVMVSGHSSGGWIYRANILDSAGPLLTLLVLEVFRDR
jgi:hypothetical protein